MQPSAGFICFSESAVRGEWEGKFPKERIVGNGISKVGAWDVGERPVYFAKALGLKV